MELIVLAIVVLILYYSLRGSFSTAKIKGARGESRVARKLGKLRSKDYRVFNDVLIKTSWGSSQIDHIIISRYGIFVIETKSYSGWIHGNDNSQYWTQSIYEKKTMFRNPVRQNWGHVYALKEILFNQLTYHSIIVFSGSAELKNVYSKVPVIYDSQLVRIIKDLSIKPLLSIAQVNKLADRLTASIKWDRKAKVEHARQVRNRVSERKRKVRLKICPTCEGDLVIRTGPYGKFYGCSNFPKCKYKMNC